MNTDLIAGPAIRFPDKRIFAGAPHHFLEQQHRGPQFPEQGYVTQSGRFLTRTEAFVYASKTGQLKPGLFTGLLYDNDFFTPKEMKKGAQ